MEKTIRHISTRRSHSNLPDCGDAAFSIKHQNVETFAIIDGLGHGKYAQDAANKCISSIKKNIDLPLNELFKVIDKELQTSRGCALGLIRIGQDHFSYAAVGNTRCMLFTENKRKLLPSSPGIIGAGFKELYIEEIKLKDAFIAGLWTDGLKETLEDRGLLLQSLLGQVKLREACSQIFDNNLSHMDDACLLLIQSEPNSSSLL